MVRANITRLGLPNLWFPDEDALPEGQLKGGPSQVLFLTPIRCTACGTRNDIEIPSEQSLEGVTTSTASENS